MTKAVLFLEAFELGAAEELGWFRRCKGVIVPPPRKFLLNIIKNLQLSPSIDSMKLIPHKSYTHTPYTHNSFKPDVHPFPTVQFSSHRKLFTELHSVPNTRKGKS